VQQALTILERRALPQPIAFAADLDDVGVTQQPVKHGAAERGCREFLILRVFISFRSNLASYSKIPMSKI
jgi:hypothetical protein